MKCVNCEREINWDSIAGMFVHNAPTEEGNFWYCSDGKSLHAIPPYEPPIEVKCDPPLELLWTEEAPE